MQKNKFRILSALFLIIGFLTISGCGCKPTVERYKVDLEVWGVMDDSDVFAETFRAYRDANPNVGEINYKKQRIESYEKDLIDALASGKGPDIFLIHNTWLPTFLNKITPAPADILTEQRFRTNFVDVVVDDFVSKGEIFAVPLSVNSLALYYNKDLFNAAGITSPPKTWDEFVSNTERITRVNAVGEINPSGAAMGTAYNINRSTDVLNMLMIQKGVSMREADGRAGFGRNENARRAVEFYTSFARSSAPNYSWNPQLHYSIDAFSEGTLAMMLNYSWQADIIRSKSPKLNFAVADIPQMLPGSPANYANYWGYAVASNKIITQDPKKNYMPITNDMRVAQAWKLLSYLTTKDGFVGVAATTSKTDVVKKPASNFDPAEKYLGKTKQPAARRDLIEKQKEDVNLGVFSKGNLIAKSWVQKNPAMIEGIFAEMINDINRGAADVSDALSVAEERIMKSEANP